MSTPRKKTKVASAPRVALDTSVLLQALLLNDPKARRLRQAWQDGRYTPLIDGVSAQALMRALAFPGLQLDEDQQHEVLADFLPYAEVVPEPAVAARRNGIAALDLAANKTAAAEVLVIDCPVLRANFARRISRVEKGACRVLGSEEFFAGLAA